MLLFLAWVYPKTLFLGMCECVYLWFCLSLVTFAIHLCFALVWMCDADTVLNLNSNPNPATDIGCVHGASCFRSYVRLRCGRFFPADKQEVRYKHDRHFSVSSPGEYWYSSEVLVLRRSVSSSHVRMMPCRLCFALVFALLSLGLHVRSWLKLFLAKPCHACMPISWCSLD